MQNGVSTTLVEESQSKLSPKEMFFKYLVYLPWFIISLGCAITIAYLYIRYTVPLYGSGVSILIKNDRTRPTGTADISLENLMSSRTTSLANEMVVLRSATTMRRVVKSLGLQLQYFGEGKVKRSEFYDYLPVKATVVNMRDSLSGTAIIIKKLKGNVVASWENNKEKVIRPGEVITTSKGELKLDFVPQALIDDYTYFINWLSDWGAAGQLAGSLDVRQPAKDAGVININIITEVPQKGRDVLTQLIREYDQLTVEDRNRLAGNSIQFIEERLGILSGELGRVEDDLQGFQQRNSVVELGTQSSTSFSRIQLLQNELNAKDMEIRIIDMIREYVSNPARKFELVPSSLGINDPTLSSLINMYNTLQLSREEELRSIPATHPTIKTKEHQIEKVRLSMIENLKNVSRTAESLRNQKKSEYYSTVGSLNSIPAKKRELLEIERQQSIKERLFLFLLQKREELAITKASTSANTTAVDPPYSWGPVSPNTTNIYRMAFLIGLILPVGFIYLRDLLNDKLVTRADLLKATDTPLIGEVAHHASMTRKFVVGLKDRSILAEQFRIIRTNLQFLLTQAPSKNPVFLVTSSIAGEGKTFCSMNLAAVWAVAGKKTVIIELDLRKPKISKALSLQRETGLTNYILGTSRKEELPQLLPDVPNLYVIGAGPIPPNPSEMIMDAKMDELFTYLRANFDIIIIDSAPIGLVSDSKILSRFADATLYVVRQRYTVKKQIAFVDELYTQKILPNMGIIVNDVKIGGANSYYGYGYGYGYGYSYNYNYSYSYGETQKKSLVQKVRDIVGL